MRNPLKSDAFGRITALAMLGIAGVWLVYDVVDAVRYFSQDYQRLRWVGLAVMVGAPALLISRMLSVSWRHRVGSWGLGIAACALTGFACYVVYAWWKLREIFAVGGGGWLMALICVMVWGDAAWFWWLLCRRRQTTPQTHEGGA
jgi:hypothetical protein